MLNPIRLVNDLFEDEKLSDVELQPFANDHLIRLGNNNPGGTYSGLITDTTNAYTGFYGAITDEATKEAISEGLTITMKNTKAAVLAKLSKQEKLVAYEFGADSSTYQEFFPQGLTEYQNARLDQLPNILDRYNNAAIAHLTAGHPAEVTEVGNLIDAYTNARNAQLSAFSETDNLRTDRREARKTLTLQLTKNMLTLAIDFLENPDGFDDYYDETLLPITSSDSDDDDDDTEPPTGTAVSIAGTMVDENTLSPIVGGTVTATTAEGSTSATTDADGKYVIDIPELPASVTVDLTGDADGHVPQTRQVNIEPGGSYTEDFQLTAEAPTP